MRRSWEMPAVVNPGRAYRYVTGVRATVCLQTVRVRMEASHATSDGTRRSWEMLAGADPGRLCVHKQRKSDMGADGMGWEC